MQQAVDMFAKATFLLGTENRIGTSAVDAHIAVLAPFQRDLIWHSPARHFPAHHAAHRCLIRIAIRQTIAVFVWRALAVRTGQENREIGQWIRSFRRHECLAGELSYGW